MKEVRLPSGATLKVGVIPFATGKALYQACMEEAERIEIKTGMELAEIYKNLFCIGFSSRRIEGALWECLKRCTYNGLKIDDQTFEPEEARGDYWKLCMEVGEAVIAPFAKGLSSEFARVFQMMTGGPKSTQEAETAEKAEATTS